MYRPLRGWFYFTILRKWSVSIADDAVTGETTRHPQASATDRVSATPVPRRAEAKALIASGRRRESHTYPLSDPGPNCPISDIDRTSNRLQALFRRHRHDPGVRSRKARSDTASSRIKRP